MSSSEPLQPTSPESKALMDLLSASEKFLADKQQYPGRLYRPARLPLSALFTRSKAPIKVGYKLSPQAPPHSGTEEDLNARIEELRNTGAVRFNSRDVKDEDWYSQVRLEELQPVELVGRQLVLASAEKLYVLELGAYDGEGSYTTQFSEIVYSTADGLLKYEGQHEDPIAQAIEYLSDSTQHPRAR